MVIRTPKDANAGINGQVVSGLEILLSVSLLETVSMRIFGRIELIRNLSRLDNTIVRTRCWGSLTLCVNIRSVHQLIGRPMCW